MPDGNQRLLSTATRTGTYPAYKEHVRCCNVVVPSLAGGEEGPSCPCQFIKLRQTNPCDKHWERHDLQGVAMPNSQQRLVSVAVTDGVSAWERHDLLLMLLLMLLAAAGWEALGLRFTVAVAVTVRLHFF